MVCVGEVCADDGPPTSQGYDFLGLEDGFELVVLVDEVEG